MSEDESNTDIEIYMKLLKDERVRNILFEDKQMLNKIFNNKYTQKLLFEDEYAKKFIDENCIFIHTADGTILAHKSELPFEQTNSDV